jgi:hypothetical protein
LNAVAGLRGQLSRMAGVRERLRVARDVYGRGSESAEFDAARVVTALARAVRIGAVRDGRDDDRYLLVLDEIQDAVLPTAG